MLARIASSGLRSVSAFKKAAAAFAPTPNQRIDTRLHFNFGNFGGKKVDEKEAVKLAETVDDVGALPTEIAGLTPELDGLRKANALFNQGLISVDEIDEYADTLAAAKRKEVAEKERDAREAAEPALLFKVSGDKGLVADVAAGARAGVQGFVVRRSAKGARQSSLPRMVVGCLPVSNFG